MVLLLLFPLSLRLHEYLSEQQRRTNERTSASCLELYMNGGERGAALRCAALYCAEPLACARACIARHARRSRASAGGRAREKNGEKRGNELSSSLSRWSLARRRRRRARSFSERERGTATTLFLPFASLASPPFSVAVNGTWSGRRATATTANKSS